MTERDRIDPGQGSDAAHSRLVRECLAELALMGFAAWENQRRAIKVNGRWVSLSKSGRGDIHVILPMHFDGIRRGIHGEIECKTGRSTQAPKQRAHMRVVRSSGGVYLVVRNASEVGQKLAEIGIWTRHATGQG